MSNRPEAAEAVHWFVTTAVHNNKLLSAKGKHTDVVKDVGVIEKLESLGCNREVLLNTISYAIELPNLYPKFKASDLEKLGDDINDLLKRIKKFTPPGINLPVLREVNGKMMLEAVPIGGDLHISDDFVKDLRAKGQAYTRMAELCRSGVIPDFATFRMIAHLWPLIYVNAATGKPRYSLVSELLSYTNIQRSSRVLRRSFELIQKRYPGIVRWLEIMPNVLQETASFGFGT
jgi:hypothetical protein